jgi:hypothetical protein
MGTPWAAIIPMIRSSPDALANEGDVSQEFSPLVVVSAIRLAFVVDVKALSGLRRDEAGVFLNVLKWNVVEGHGPMMRLVPNVDLTGRIGTTSLMTSQNGSPK